MVNIADICINENKSIKEAMKTIDQGALGISFVVNKDNELVGVVTDGDIRREILKGTKLETKVKKIMNTSPIYIKKDWGKEKIKKFLKTDKARSKVPKYGFIRIPVLDEKKRITDIIFATEEKYESIKKPTVKLKDRLKPVNNVLVVGGAGYLGSILCRKLLEKGYIVSVLDNLTYGDYGIKELYKHPKFEFIKGDLRDIQTVVEVTKGIEGVIHLAAIVGDPASALNPQETIEINYLGTKMLAEVCKYSQINRFIFASTCSVYGSSPTPDTKIDEKSQLNPVSLYAEMKLKSEQGLLEIADENFSPTIMRMATLYGLSPRMRFDLVVNTLAIKALKEQRIFIFGGQQWRPQLHVQDAAEAYIKCLEAPINKVGGKTFNVGSNKDNYKIIEIGEKIKKMIPKTEVIVEKDKVDRRNYNISFDKIKNNLNYKTKKTVEDGIQEIKKTVEKGMFNDYKNNKYSNYKFLQKNNVNKK